jgi:hypothetical protein
MIPISMFYLYLSRVFKKKSPFRVLFSGNPFNEFHVKNIKKITSQIIKKLKLIRFSAQIFRESNIVFNAGEQIGICRKQL